MYAATNLAKGSAGLPFWTDATRLARKQTISVPAPRSAVQDRRATSPFEFIHGRKPDLSSWAAGPLAAVFVWLPGKPHPRSEARAELGLYVGPCTLFLNTPDPTGARTWERTLAPVEPLLGVPVAIIDLEGPDAIGIGEAALGERTVASSLVAGRTRGAGTTGGDCAATSAGKGAVEGPGAGGIRTGFPEGQGSGSSTPGGKSNGTGAARGRSASTPGSQSAAKRNGADQRGGAEAGSCAAPSNGKGAVEGPGAGGTGTGSS